MKNFARTAMAAAVGASLISGVAEARDRHRGMDPRAAALAAGAFGLVVGGILAQQQQRQPAYSGGYYEEEEYAPQRRRRYYNGGDYGRGRQNCGWTVVGWGRGNQPVQAYTCTTR